ncbi:PaREP1 family protein [Hyperthermus butylicus]|uniref:Archaeal PaREP8 protein n=1 Tax=Hyperthermus butylicus (strain DSM 5456 / JCM 9403 / PLM1-5) TaxID=415426 RepID=A2BKM1_HYPBU|nr:PaREP1 family protein [Hyperthermus butylicus]ABM80532.1 Archaeal PaREP8 protein [Hyperthermus butylicus DSM 5456]
MTDVAAVRLPRSVVERLEREARRLGLSFEEYVLELVLRDLDPTERAREYVEAAHDLLDQAREELGRGDVRQAAEKAWGAAALAVKAYAEWKEGRRLTSHGELWEYSRKMMDELGEWVYDSWMAATGMHVCFYEGWCTKRHVEEALRRIQKLVEEVEEKLKS